MNLDQLKDSMSTLDEMLAQKGYNTIRLNTSTCNTAQKKIMKRYSQGALASLLIGAIFILQWQAGLGVDKFPFHLRIFLIIFLAISAVWYLFLYSKTKKINIFVSTPMQTVRQVASLRRYALVAEITLALAMTVFFTLFLSNLWNIKAASFWVIIAFLAIEVILFLAVFLPHIIRDFSNLTSMI